MEFDDLIIDDLSVEKKKKVNGKKKGNRLELQLSKILTKRFGQSFSRSVGSGNRWSQVSNMPAHAKETLVGDLCCPVGFKFVVECKGGYEDKIDLNSILEGGCSQLDKFIDQSEHDAELSGKLPIIIWKRNNKPWLSMIRAIDYFLDAEYSIKYRDWVIITLDELLKLDDSFWFNKA